MCDWGGGAHDRSHCDCGAYDPDCCLTLNADVFNCKYKEVCSLSAFCVNYPDSSHGEWRYWETNKVRLFLRLKYTV